MKNCARDGGFRTLRLELRRATCFLFVASVVGLSPAGLQAGSLTINASSDADLSDTTGGGTFTVIDRLDLATHGLYVTDFIGGAAPNFEDRAAILFSLASLPKNATITGLTFNFDETSFANAVGTIAINGYSSTGTITLADATAAASSLGTYDALSLGLGNHSVTLSTSFLQSLLGGGASFLGIRLQGTQYSDNTSLGSVEQSTAYSPPTLSVTFSSVPEPSSFALLIAGLPCAMIALRHRDKRRAA